MGHMGYKNYKTWRVILWINNDEPTYLIAKKATGWISFCGLLREQGIKKLDTISLRDPELYVRELTQAIKQIHEST